MQLSSLRHLYIKELEKNGYPKVDYRSEKLKSHLEDHKISRQIAFAKVKPGDKGFITFNLVYNATITTADVVAYAYRLGSRDKFEDVALLLRDVILQAINMHKSLPWPPMAADLEIKSEDLPPLELIKFLNIVMSGEADVEEKSEKMRRLVLSFG